MKRLVLVLACAASLIAPSMAMAAGYQGDHDRGRHERHERWDGRRDWWHGRSEWRDYRGVRPGYHYAPRYGYYRIEPRFYGHVWRRGEYLPPAYRGYVVEDPYYFGARVAPRGYVWVWMGNDLVLISRHSGLILDVVRNVY